jgi:folate-binding protein YgfZ
MSQIVHENDAVTVMHSPESVAGFRVLTTSCGIVERTDHVHVQFGGKDRTRWMNGQITNNIRDLAAGQGVYGFLLNPQGQIQGDLYAYNRGEYLFVDLERGQMEKVLGQFRRYIIMDKVEITEVPDAIIEVTGPNAAEVLTKAGFQLPELQPLQVADVQWNGIRCTVVRKDVPVVPSLEIWCAPENSNAIQAALSKAGGEIVGLGAMELLRVACGIPKIGQDIRERDLPQETEQARALNFNKGCYIGQEIVERIRSRGNVHRKLTGFLIEGPAPPLGTAIQVEGKSVGEITSVASLPANSGSQNAALGFLRREHATPGNTIQVGEAKVIISSLPFTKFLEHSFLEH